MFKVDKQVHDGDTDIREFTPYIPEEIKEKTEKRTVEFYRKHPDRIGDILSMLKEEAQRHLVTAFIEAGNEPTAIERGKLNAAMKISPSKEREKALEPLLSLLSVDRHFTYDVVFSDDSLRTRLYLALGAYLNLLQETDPEMFQQASDFIESCILDKKHLAITWGQALGVLQASPEKVTVLNITTQRAKEVIFGVSKVENLAFDPRENNVLYNDPYPVNVWVGTSKKRKIETIVSIDFNEMRKMGVVIKNEQRLTPYDRAVHNAVSTLCAIGNKYINPQMIFQVLSGNLHQRKDMSSETRKKILESYNGPHKMDQWK